jgi:hypothetical protein
MFKKTATIIIFLITPFILFCQSANIEKEIHQYKESKPVMIDKARTMLLDMFSKGDLVKVKEIKDFLLSAEDEKFNSFFLAEYWFILYWTQDYNELCLSLQSLDSAKIERYKQRTWPKQDSLYTRLYRASMENELFLKQLINESDADKECREIAALTLDKLLIESRNTPYAQDSINEKADNILNNSETKRYNDYIKKHIRYRLIAKNWSGSVEFFTGYGIITGELSNTYDNFLPIGAGFGIGYRNLELSVRAINGNHKIKRDLGYSTGIYTKNSKVRIFIPEMTLGYSILNNNYLKISPFGGIGLSDISVTTDQTDEIPELKELSTGYSPMYVAGLNIEVKFGPKKLPEFMPKTNYSYLNIRYNYGMPQLEKKHAGMNGNFHYFTIGYGTMSRGTRRQ